MSVNTIPASVIAPLVRSWLEKYTAHRTSCATDGYVKNADNEGNLAVLAFQSGVASRTLRLIKSGQAQGPGSTRVEHISFDTADKIVCATLGPLAWHTEESLMPYYGPLEVTTGELKKGYELPEGFDFHGLPQAKKYQWLSARREELAAA